jgi:hypothetical protein
MHTYRSRPRQASLSGAILLYAAAAACAVAVFLAVGVIVMSSVNVGVKADQMVAAPAPGATLALPRQQPAPARYRFAGHTVGSTLRFCADDSGIRPSMRRLGFYIEQAVELLQEAAGGALRIAADGDCPGVGATVGDGYSSVAWSSLEGSVAGRALYRVEDGLIDEADVELERDWSTAGDECITAVLMHEFGHALGLGHQDDQDSIMKSNTDCVPRLSERDADALRHLYP